MKPKTYLCLLAAAGVLTGTSLPMITEAASADLDIARKLNQAFIEVADKVSPAVVVVKVKQKPGAAESDEDGGGFFDMLPPGLRRRLEEQFDKDRKEQQRRRPSQRQFDGQGSGVVIREDGYILTNRHVVENAEEIEVSFKDGTKYVAKVRGMDPQSDIAVLKIEPKDAHLPTARLADSAKTRVGEFAIAIGAPFELDYSVTVGHVSAKGRRVVSDTVMMDQDFIQTDASINPGNSGGPLVNIEGEVIGINTMIRGMRTGIGFAVPSNLAREISDKLIADGKFTHVWLGIGIDNLSNDKDLQKTIKTIDKGVVVKRIEPNGPSADSDLEPGDIITAVDGKQVATVPDLKNEIRLKEAGKPVTLEVVRDDKKMKVKVKPDELPENRLAFNKPAKRAPVEETKSLGLTVKPLTRELAEEYDTKKVDGVIVTDVEPGSLAESRGIKAGDIITKVNRKPVTSPKEFRDAFKDADLKKGVSIQLGGKDGKRFEFLKESGD
ncbi:MAG: trypsin-like peptidase domain-containing protein [Verrucomicrobia bacterium]|nr:trypsin-like peptidase domain-containing protein [Verrucomicrobiota bacterium]